MIAPGRRNSALVGTAETTRPRSGAAFGASLAMSQVVSRYVTCGAAALCQARTWALSSPCRWWVTLAYSDELASTRTYGRAMQSATRLKKSMVESEGAHGLRTRGLEWKERCLLVL